MKDETWKSVVLDFGDRSIKVDGPAWVLDSLARQLAERAASRREAGQEKVEEKRTAELGGDGNIRIAQF